MAGTRKRMTDLIAEQLEQEVVVVVGREPKRMSRSAAIVTRAIDQAIRGETRALRDLVQIAGHIPALDPDAFLWRISRTEVEKLDRFLTETLTPVPKNRREPG
jgi:hypothetical protein